MLGRPMGIAASLGASLEIPIGGEAGQLHHPLGFGQPPHPDLLRINRIVRIQFQHDARGAGIGLHHLNRLHRAANELIRNGLIGHNAG
jgi:hypothetical protein